MQFDELAPDELWRFYQRGYSCLVRSGLYFRQVLRPALSHVYFHRALPLLLDYARANHGMGDLPPSFGDQMEACPLTARDLLHLDYAICLGYAESQGSDRNLLTGIPVMEWPGPMVGHSLFIAADIWGHSEDTSDALEVEVFEPDAEEEEEAVEDDEPEPPFDL